MRVLLVEDDRVKAARISEFVESLDFIYDVHVEHAYKSGCVAAVEEEYDLMLLDMTMPMFEKGHSRDSSGKTLVYGGIKLLRELCRKGYQKPAIFVTQFESFGEGRQEKNLEQLRSDLNDNFGSVCLGLVFYGAAEDDWKHQLKLMLENLEAK